MNAALYDRFRKVEEINKELQCVDPSSRIDVDGVQRNVLASYTDNEVLSEVLSGEVQLESKLSELNDEINKGIKRILPRKRDPEHNRYIDSFEELLGATPVTGSLDSLRARGRWFPDNLVNGFIGGTVGGLIMFYFMSQLGEPIDPEKVGIWNYVSAAVGLVGGLYTGIGGQAIMRPGKLPIARAKYLDERIAELHAPQQ